MRLAQKRGVAVKGRRLKVGWGRNPGPLPKYIENLVKNHNASRNIYVGRIENDVTDEKLRKDFQEYGEIENINIIKERKCGFVNFTSISSAINALNHIKKKEEYKNYYINYGKDHCGNATKEIIDPEDFI